MSDESIRLMTFSFIKLDHSFHHFQLLKHPNHHLNIRLDRTPIKAQHLHLHLHLHLQHYPLNLLAF